MTRTRVLAPSTPSGLTNDSASASICLPLAAASMRARPGRAGLLRLSLAVRPGPEGVREAEQKLRDLFVEIAPALAW